MSLAIHLKVGDSICIYRQFAFFGEITRYIYGFGKLGTFFDEYAKIVQALCIDRDMKNKNIYEQLTLKC